MAPTENASLSNFAVSPFDPVCNMTKTKKTGAGKNCRGPKLALSLW